MGLIVQKYGGTSVATTERISKVADHIISKQKQGHQIVVAVSAMGHHTDELKELALKLSPQPPQRELDMLLSVGERVSMALLCIALAERGAEAISLTGSQSGILTTASHGRAMIVEVKPHRILKGLAENKIVIVAGFQGMSAQTYEITTLGRGGTDLTAVALAKCLNADRCEIYKDVDGVYSSDPRLNPSAKKYDRLSWEEAYCLTLAGADVLHDRACALAIKERIPLWVGSSFDLNASGTEINGDYQQRAKGKSMEGYQITGITRQKNITCLELAGDFDVYSSNLKQWLEAVNLKQIFYNQQQAAHTIYLQGEYETSRVPEAIRAKILKSSNQLEMIHVIGYQLDLVAPKVKEQIKFLNVQPHSVYQNNTAIQLVFSKNDAERAYPKICEVQ